MVIRLLIGLLLFAAVPVMAADGTRIAPQLAQLQAQDSLLEQLQSRTREAETRAAEAERREREAEINRLTDQAQQAQARADAEAQRNLAAQRELFIQQAKTELHNSAYSRLEIIVGGFGALITVLVIFFALRTEKTAVAEAVKGVGEEIKARVAETEALLAKMREHETAANKILQSLRPAEAPKSAEDRETVAEVAREANAKPPRDRTANEYRAILTNLLIRKEWADMLEAAQQMRLLHGGDDNHLFFALFNEAYAFGQLGRSKEAIAVYDDVVARYGSASEPALRKQVASALFNKGIALGTSDRSEEAIAVFDEVVARYGAASETALLQQVAMALVNKGVALGALNRSEEAIAVYDEVVARYGAASEAGLRQEVAGALFNKGVALGALNRSEDSIAVYDDVVARYGAASEVALLQQVAMALVNKVIVLAQLERREDAIATCDDVIARFDDSREPELREILGHARTLKAQLHSQHGK